MRLRVIAMLAWTLALPAFAFAQTPAVTGRPTTHQSAPVHAGTASQPAGPVLIDINSADEATLDSLPGVGPVRAKAIVANRPYAEKQDLVTKKAVPANVFAQIEDKIALINVNTATAATMAKILPNVGPVRAQKIVDSRPYATSAELVSKGALTAGVYSGVQNLVTVGK